MDTSMLGNMMLRPNCFNHTSHLHHYDDHPNHDHSIEWTKMSKVNQYFQLENHKWPIDASIFL